jgi:hypothetical protein
MGFEPTVHCCTPAFQAGTFNHSATLPHILQTFYLWLTRQPMNYFFINHSATSPCTSNEIEMGWTSIINMV